MFEAGQAGTRHNQICHFERRPWFLENGLEGGREPLSALLIRVSPFAFLTGLFLSVLPFQL